LNELLPLVRTVLEQFGVRRLAGTEDRNMNAAFAQWRQLYEEAAERMLCNTSSQPVLKFESQAS
jgi:hypothetical protein